MEEIIKLYDSVPLPYKYVNVPRPNEPQNKSSYPIAYYVNQVITNLTRSGFKHCGFAVTEDNRTWNASWGRQYQADEYQRCKSWQKINHFAGAFLMGRKDNLHNRMTELAKRGPGLADFYPKSYLLPNDKDAFAKAYEKTKLWIVKPSASSRGRGIHLVCSEKDPIPTQAGIVQTYIERPMLITKRKFDIRLYALITSCNPLRIYMHHSGLARFCTHPYDINGDYQDDHMHLTNFSINKEDDQFKRCDDGVEHIEDSKWSLPFFLKHLRDTGINTDMIMEKLEHVTIMTVIAGMSEIRKYHEKLIPHRHASYEMYGIDIMLDDQMNPHFIEINISPSMSGLDSKLDQEIKFPLQLDLLRMARIIDCNPKLKNPCPAVDMIDQEWRETMTKKRVSDIQSGVDGWEDPNFGDLTMIRDYVEEQPILGGFRRVFPKRKTMDRFIPAFGELTYRDRMFQSWIRKDNQGRLDAVMKNFEAYKNEIQRITKDSQIIMKNMQ
ncbi:Tubulin-tyrosine ligase family protein [Trichomonas vaginalis G3]|uniref:Tubulin--tyrosine ligase-like protein 5 n=1 Tax=Trichomonas vaginalis (strain ATCC PRA-98 / G3) TaxID=412133 RepID=A2DPF2_TRIV3|nr:protein polyglutamylation [Trichomonas vaginalis G3]EAY17696.1 Tubulin-tyrosine ligase family protein [Trichomonas vaginalis G3]KAI5507900.1 protein polyglutamylation [Trichomonas vaginalis G3]|eukprot:XP_001329831.1 Tubulin-tyrosine ligase family protein [Trichomonas vaginalis G3]